MGGRGIWKGGKGEGYRKGIGGYRNGGYKTWEGAIERGAKGRGAIERGEGAIERGAIKKEGGGGL